MGFLFDMKCKNTECENDTKDSRVYCSLRCRNVYVNTHLRDYTKVSKTLSKESEYLLNPKQCKYCNGVIPYGKRRNEFCGSSCSTTYVNMRRPNEFYENHSKVLKERGYIPPHIISDEHKEYSKNPKKCNNCNEDLTFNKRLRNFCSKQCKSIWNRSGSLQNYRLQCRFNFNLSDYPNEFDFTLIEEYGWYSAKNRGDNLYGVSRDHMFSVREGFLKDINPEIISHPANCRLMLHSHNVSKGTKCDITYDELINRIENWNIKYGGIV